MPSPSSLAGTSQPLTSAPVVAPRTWGLRHRPWVWAGSLVALIALLALTPPLVNANRYRTRVAESISRSLGRPVHLDNVSLHLLPVPGFTLENFVVSEDPDFGAEPTIRANTVEATLRVSSLWHRPVEFSTVRFVEPSVNLVRNAQGRWNLSEVLVHASRVESAPTTQGHAGPAPRFPYIEATGGRVNVKLGVEKLPFSLTDADFALWLPSGKEWRVRLVGHPARTDTDITDPGTIRLDGTLQRAATIAAVPVDFRASWHDAPLGEATRIVTGADLGWRGALNVDATVAGTLGDAQFDSKTTLGGLRRAEFFPAHPLDLQITCGSRFAIHPATLTGLDCSLPTGGPQPLVAAAPVVHLQGVASTPATLQGTAIPMRWVLLWAGLFSPRVHTAADGRETVDLAVQRDPGAPAPAPGKKTAAATRGSWTGTLRVNLPAPQAGEIPTTLPFTIGNAAGGAFWPGLHLPPTAVTAGADGALTLTSDIDPAGYRVSVNGTASAALLRAPAQYLPELGDGLDAVLPAGATADNPVHVQFACERSWSTAQTCSEAAPAAAPAGERTPSTHPKHPHRH